MLLLLPPLPLLLLELDGHQDTRSFSRTHSSWYLQD
jgi:hypothetical protein